MDVTYVDLRSKMMEEIGKSVRRLSEFLSPEFRKSILNLLLDSYKDDKSLTEDIGCSISSLQNWKENETSINNENMSKILALALTRCQATINLLREALNEFEGLCEDLGVLECEKGDLDRFMGSLDEKSKAMFWHFFRNRHAGIRELAELINASTDMDVLTRVKEVINPKADEILGKEILKFEEVKIDKFTGKKIAFSWWLTEDLLLEKTGEIVDIFDEKDRLILVTELSGVKEEGIKVEVKNDMLTISGDTDNDKYQRKIPLFYTVRGDVETKYKNGVLEVRLKKLLGEAMPPNDQKTSRIEAD